MITVLAAATIGATLGLRFKAFILVPAITLISIVSCGVGVAHKNGVWSILLAILLITISLQIGYLIGVVIRFGIARPSGRKRISAIAAILKAKPNLPGAFARD